MRGTIRRPGTRSDFFREVNAVKSITATSAPEIQVLVVSSKIASVYRIDAQASWPVAAMARLTAGSIRTVIETCAPLSRRPDGYRSGNGGSDNRTSRPTQPPDLGLAQFQRIGSRVRLAITGFWRLRHRHRSRRQCIPLQLRRDATHVAVAER